MHTLYNLFFHKICSLNLRTSAGCTDDSNTCQTFTPTTCAQASRALFICCAKSNWCTMSEVNNRARSVASLLIPSES